MTTPISRVGALEETFFLGLRLIQGVDLIRVSDDFGPQAVDQLRPAITELENQALLDRFGDSIRLTSRGRLLSNEVFQAFLAPDPAKPVVS